MGRGAVRWIAIALVGAMVAFVAVGLVGGADDGDGAGSAGGDGTGAGPDVTATEVVEGPHVIVELCAGVACPEVDQAAQQALLAEVDGDPRVASTLFVSSEQAYQLFLDRYGDQEELVASVNPDDVPARIEVDLVDPEAAADVAATYEDGDGVATAYDARALTP